MANDISKLTDSLFEQMEKLSSSEISGEKLEAEIARAKSITAISSQIISAGNLVLNAQKLKVEYGLDENAVPLLVEK